jgi:hypothetical protein
VARDDERRGAGTGFRVYARMRRRTETEQENGSDRDGSTHRGDPSEDSDEASKGADVQQLFFTET